MALEQTSGRDPAQATTIEAAWREVVTLNPMFADAHARLAQRMADSGSRLDEARQIQQRAIQLAPGTDHYVLGLARMLILLRQPKEARALLGPLAARGGTPEIAATARRYLGNAAQVELAMTAGTPPREPAGPSVTAGVAPSSSSDPPATREPPVAPLSPPPAAEPGARRNADRNVERLLLRHVRDGETRIFGMLKAIECTSDAARLVIETARGPVRILGGTLDTMDFVSYRDDIKGGINCGPQQQAVPVLVTYRPEPEDGTAGELIIVEVVPVGYKPPGR